ncbi:hypothetical protein O6H91_07G010900 [Diphasiastrum complanatum]|uniref:Uncharacterized protein n=1 Tax=Diphasiastrum complanatum TaxID=34168 RepID=A0ACC2D2H9_DIPCM|nr:hypothetical protein O6H91_07G010900 [Diphasiastrum complanatum]
MRILDVQLFMGSAYHSTSDGQSEVLNRILEDYLRHFVTPSGKDWDQHLCLAEYSYNISVSTSTGVAPFLLSHGYAPLLPGIPLPPEDTPVTLSSFLSGARELILQASSHLQQVQQRYQASVDRHRRHVEFHVGDMVYLRLRFARHHFIQGHASIEKLAPRYYGPYCILEVLSPVTYRLQLPASTRACDIFHVSLLRAAIEDDAPRDAEFPTALDLFPLLPAANFLCVCIIVDAAGRFSS